MRQIGGPIVPNDIVSLVSDVSGILPAVNGGTGGAYGFVYNPAPANLGFSGASATHTAGPALAFGDLCFMGPDGKWWKGIGNLSSVWAAGHAYNIGDVIKPTATQTYFLFCTTAGTSAAVTEPSWNTTIGATTADGTGALVWTTIQYTSIAVRRMALATINAGATGLFLEKGYVRNDAWTAVSSGCSTYLDSSTPGAYTVTPPVTAGNIQQIIGRAASQTKTIFFNPEFSMIQVGP